jgi:uncharacterized protein DUF6471
MVISPITLSSDYAPDMMVSLRIIIGGRMDKVSLAFQDKAKGILRAEIKRRNLNYEDLAKMLAEKGVEDNARNLSNKIARGAFTAGFFVMCLDAIGVHHVRLHDGP